MTRRTEYRLFFNNEPATREQLDRIETITVEQQVDMAWEARLEIPICLDRRGRWTGADEPFMRPHTRVRVEVSVLDNQFYPLIDGPVVGIDSKMQFEPGQSNLTLVVRDDSFYLDENDEHFSYDNKSDGQVVKEIFARFSQINSMQIDEDLAEGEGSFRSNGTAMQVLRGLAEVHGKHVYVLPGEEPGQSIGCFKAFPGINDRQTDSLPPLILLGSDANIRSLNLGRDIAQPEEAYASTVQISDKRVIPTAASYRDREPLGERSALPDGVEPSRRMLRPNPFMGRQMDRAVASRAQNSSYAFESSGSVIEGCYPGILQPYRLVSVKAGETPQSGAYVITHVTHTLTRSAYSQSFTLTRNAESETFGENMTSTVRSIF
jgi:hypothetical protein